MGAVVSGLERVIRNWLTTGKEAVDLPSALGLQPGQFPDVVAVIVAAEVLGPLALIIGLWPRWTALALIGFTASRSG